MLTAQEAFLPGHPTHRAIEMIRSAFRACVDEQRDLGAVFYDVSQAFDSLEHADIVGALSRLCLPAEFVSWVQDSLRGVRAQVRTAFGLGPTFAVTRSIRQGDPLSPLLFNIVFDMVHAHLQRSGLGFSHHGVMLTTRGFADDLAAVADSRFHLGELHHMMLDATRALGLTLNAKKSVCMGVSRTGHGHVQWQHSGLQIGRQVDRLRGECQVPRCEVVLADWRQHCTD